MTSMTDLAPILQQVLTTTAETAGRESGLVRRARKLTGATLTQTLVLGWLQQPAATLEDLVQAAADAGVVVSPQAIAQRLTAEAAACLKAVLEAAVERLVTGEPVASALLQRFGRVVVVDSTILPLPAALAEVWRGCGGSTPAAGTAALKVLVRLDLQRGMLDVLSLHDGQVHDRMAEEQTPALAPDTLRLADLGFFGLETLAEFGAAGVHVLSRLKLQTAVIDQAGQSWSLAAFLAAHDGAAVDAAVQLGVHQRLGMRLLAVRVPPEVEAERRRTLRAAAKREGRAPSADALALCGWLVLVTSLPPERLTLQEALVLYRVRWQIELLFKLWKERGRLEQTQFRKPWAILCAVYAKLLGLLIQHWLLVTTVWRFANKSLVKAAAVIRRQIPRLAPIVSQPRQLAAELQALADRLAHGCRLSARRAKPATYQLLLALEEDALAA